MTGVSAERARTTLSHVYTSRECFPVVRLLDLGFEVAVKTAPDLSAAAMRGQHSATGDVSTKGMSMSNDLFVSGIS